MNILVIDSHSFGQDDIICILKDLGHDVFMYGHKDLYMHQNDEVYNELTKFIYDNKIERVFSFNYFPIISYVLKDTDVKYVSYVYDSPHIAVYTCSIIFPCNSIYLFDYAVYEELHNGGVDTVHYLPLSINTNRIDNTLSNNTDSSNVTLPSTMDVSFVGSLYNEDHNLYDRLVDKLKGKYDYIHGYLDSLIQAQSKIYGYFFLEKMLNDPLVTILDSVYPYDCNDDSIATKSYVYAHYFMARKVTYIERMNLLTKVSNSFNLSLFTHNKTPDIPKANNLGTVDYYKDMPVVFSRSKINLNITLKSILTGIPLRCIDIMGSGGFLLTNYQADMFRHFEPGKHFDYYTDEDDLLCKIDYYLTHEDERMTIAENARKTVKNNHNLEDFVRYYLIG